MKEEKIERSVMTEEEFKEFIKADLLRISEAVRKFRPVKMAMRRSNISPIEESYPNRPFNNRKTTLGRSFN